MLAQLLTRLRGIRQRRRVAREVDDELQFHMEMEVQAHLERGVSLEEARRLAARDLGGLAQTRDRIRDVRALAVESLWHDALTAGRSLRRLPWLTAGIVAILAIGIGPVSAVFLLVSASYLRPWRVPNASRIALISSTTPYARGGTVSHPEYRYLREHATSFASLAATIRGGGLLDTGKASRRVQTNFVTPNYFETLGIGIAMGRGFVPTDENYQAPPDVVIVSHRLWRDVFDGDPNAIGHTVQIYQRPMTVVGVAARGFNDVLGAIGIDLWLPLPAIVAPYPSFATAFTDPYGSAGSVIGRLHPGTTRQQGLAELALLSQRYRSAENVPPTTLTATSTRPIAVYGAARTFRQPAVPAIGGGLLLVLLVACANAGNLVLARTLTRQRELAIRLSLGSSRGRVVRQLLLESFFIAVSAGTLGLLCATLLVQLWVAGQRTSPNGAPPEWFYAPDWLVFGFVALISGFACLVCSVGPAWRMSRQNLHGLAGNHHGVTAAGHRARAILIGVQVALSIVLITSASLFTRAIDRAPDADPGFALADLDMVPIRWPRGQVPTATPRQVADHLVASGFGTVALSDFPPFDQGTVVSTFQSQGPARVAGQFLTRGVSSDYFSVLGLPMVEGRSFVEGEAREEVVVSESLARLFPDGALGQYLISRDRRGMRVLTEEGELDLQGNPVGAATTREQREGLHQIVGVVKDVSVRELGKIEPVVYWTHESGQVLIVRREPSATSQQVQAVVAGLSRGAAVAAVPLKERMLEGLNQLRLASYAAWLIGLLAIALATIGILGAFSFLVEERRREFALRLALGANTRRIARAVLGTMKGALLGGVLAGISMTAVISPLLGRWLYGMSPFDPLAYLRTFAVLAAAVAMAIWLPVRRARRVDPVTVLKGD